MSRVRNWCFTVNNYTDEDLTKIATLCENDLFVYVTFGIEVGDSGTPHLQGYLELKNSITLTSLKRHMGLSSCHLESRRGTQDQAIAYCHKDGHFFEYGTKKVSAVSSSKKQKNSLLPLLDVLKTEGVGGLSNHPDCSFTILKHAKEYLVANEKGRDPINPVTVKWYYGPTGTGKTRRAYHEATKSGTVYIKSSSGKWFDGYDGEANVIFDDFRDTWFEYSYLLKLLDRYPVRVECKGSSRQFVASTIYVTSPFHPKNLYKGLQDRDVDSINQLLRRISTIEEMTEYWEPSPPRCPSISTPELELPRILTPPRCLYPVRTVNSPLVLTPRRSRRYYSPPPPPPSPHAMSPTQLWVPLTPSFDLDI